MNKHELIYSRQSIRKYKDQDVPDQDILTILDSVRVGPSSENEQNWYFIVVKNKEFMQKIQDVIQLKLDGLVAEMEKNDDAQEPGVSPVHQTSSPSSGHEGHRCSAMKVPYRQKPSHINQEQA
jgi:nitroreductase